MKEEFIECGLTPTEYDILIHLLARGTRGAGSIANALKIKRSTVYSALESLERRKLIRRAKETGPTEFVPIDTNQIPTLLASQARVAFDRVMSAIELIKPRIERFSGGKPFHAGQLEITEIETTEDYLQLLAKYIFHRDYCAMWNPQLAVYSPAVKKRLLIFFEETAKSKNKIRDILIAGPMANWYIKHIKNPYHEVRLLEDKNPGLADQFVVDNSVIISLNSPESENALEIKNQHYADFARWQFTSLWDRLAPAD